MRLVITILIIAIVAIGASFFISSAHASLPDFTCEKDHTVSGSVDGALTDYPVRFVVHKGNGTDSGQDVYLNNKCQAWPCDIRFADGEDRFLDCWFESCDQSAATVWVRMDTIPASPGSATVRLYYGNISYPYASDGNKVFTLFDDFISTHINDDIWRTKVPSTYVYSYGYLSYKLWGDSTDSGFETKANYGAGYSAAARFTSNYCGQTDNQWVEFGWVSPVNHALEVIAQPDTEGAVLKVRNGNAVNWLYRDWVGWTENTFHVAEVQRPAGSGKITFLIDGDPVSYTGKAPNDAMTAGIILGKRNGADTPKLELDYFFIRKMTLNEPAHGRWSTPVAPRPDQTIYWMAGILAALIIVMLALVTLIVLSKKKK